MSIPQQRLVADSILAKLETIDPHAMLAGGAPRDWSFGYEATDLDFYIHLTTMSIADLHKELFDIGLLQNALYPNDFEIVENYKQASAVRWVVTVGYESQKVQIVVMHHPIAESVLQHFSLSICKIWYKNQTIHTTPEFLKTIEEKVIRQVQPAFNDNYIEKILAKFPDYTFVALQEEDIMEFEF